MNLQFNSFGPSRADDANFPCVFHHPSTFSAHAPHLGCRGGFLAARPAGLQPRRGAAAATFTAPFDSRHSQLTCRRARRRSRTSTAYSLHNTHLEQYVELCCLWRMASCINVE